MNSPQNLIKDKRKALMLALAALQVFLLFGHIIPIYEKMPYYENKIRLLKESIDKLETSALHSNYYIKRKNSVEKELSEFQKVIQHLNNPNYIQKRVSEIQKNNHLDVTSQKISYEDYSSEFTKIAIKQTLTGKYHNQIDYLNEIIRAFEFIILTDCELTNNAVLNSNPSITMDLSLIIFLIKTR